MQIDWVDSDWASVDKNEAQNYLNFCKKAASEDSIFNTFRSNKLYGRVLEGGEYEIGLRSIKY